MPARIGMLRGMDALDLPRTTLALADVLEERKRQHATHGTQTLGHGLRFSERREMARLLELCRAAQEPKARRWADVLLEEACEVVLATNALDRRAELVQLAAVCVQQIEAIDREGEGVRAGGYASRWSREAPEGSAPAPHDYAPAWQRVAPDECTRADALEKALRELVYEEGGRWFAGIIGDADVTDIVGAVLSKPSASPKEPAWSCKVCNGPWLVHRSGVACVAPDLPGYDANGSPA